MIPGYLFNRVKIGDLVSNCLKSQGEIIKLVFHGVPCFNIAFRMTNNFLIQAVRATFLAFPATSSL